MLSLGKYRVKKKMQHTCSFSLLCGMKRSISLQATKTTIITEIGQCHVLVRHQATKQGTTLPAGYLCSIIHVLKIATLM